MITWLASIAVLAFVMAATPGPNNVLFAASGARVGYLRTVPGLAGMLAGFAIIISACGVGVGELVARSPGLQSAMTLLASGYMVWLSYRLWTAPTTMPNETDTQVLTWIQMAAFQLLNPKTWLAALAFASGYLAGNKPDGFAADLLGVGVFLSVVLLAASSWTLFGATFRARLGVDHWGTLNRLLAGLALVTVITFWI